MGNILCPWEPAVYLLSSSNVPELIYYSHGTAILAALGIGILVFANNPKDSMSRLFLLFTFLFSVWALLDVILWATNDPAVVMFSWSLQVLIEPVTYIIAFYLFYIFLYQKPPGLLINILFSLLLIPLILLLPTTLNLEGLLLSTCESIEGPIAKYYTYFINVIMVMAIILIGIKRIPTLETRNHQSTALYFELGLVTFLLSFTSGNIISSFTDDWTLSQYGLFGMPIFAGLIAYSIVRHKAFNIKMAGVQAFTIVLWALVASLLLVVKSDSSRIVSGATLVFTTFAGYFLVKSVKKEIKQREQIENLAKDLENANVRLKELDKLKSEFVSIASHQLRSPLTAIRGYASLLIEGSYGKLPQKAAEALDRISESAKNMAYSIEDYLNVSRIESGNMKYNLSDFNLKDETEKITDDLRPQAVRRGLTLLFRSDLKGGGVINADIGKVIQIIQNLLNNSIKYTETGSIKVLVRDDVVRKKIFVDIIDTGIGMSPKTLSTLFGKFERAENANIVNNRGTGLGLYVAKMMTEAMKGTIKATSEGDGKGSVFTIEFPLVT